MFSTLADIFGHISNLVYLVGSIIKGSMALRLSWVVGAIAELLYYVYATDEPLWTSIIWCLVITALNVYQIVLLLIHRRKKGLSSREQELYNLLFKAMDWANFRQMMKTAQWEVVNDERTIIIENEPVEHLFLLSNGVAEVTLLGKRIAHLQNGSFIGEMSLLTGQLPTATVRVKRGSTLVSWPKSAIAKLQQANESLNNELYAVFSRDIIEKIKQQNVAVTA